MGIEGSHYQYATHCLICLPNIDGRQLVPRDTEAILHTTQVPEGLREHSSFKTTHPHKECILSTFCRTMLNLLVSKYDADAALDGGSEADKSYLPGSDSSWDPLASWPDLVAGCGSL